MNRRNGFFLTILIAFLCLAFFLPMSVTAADKPIKLRLHSYAPPPPSASGVGTQWFIDEVKERTNGRVDFQVFWSGSMAPPKGQLELIQYGAVDIEKTCTLYFPGKFVISHFEYSFPFGPTDPVMVSNAKRQIYEEFQVKKDEYKKFGTIMLANHVAPYYQLLSKKRISTVKDLKGMKVGVIGRWFGKWLEPVGVVPVIMPAGERYVALQSGVLDGDLLWLDLQYALSLHEQAEYLVEIGFGSFIPEDLMMNRKSFNRLPKDIQQILLDVGRESELWVAQKLKQKRLDVLKKMKASGITVLEFPDSEKAKWAQMVPDTPAVWAREAEAAGIPGFEIAKRWQEITAEMGYKWPRKWAVK